MSERHNCQTTSAKDDESTDRRCSARAGSLALVADRGYFSGPEIRACDLNDISAYVPKPLTSASRKKGLLTRADLVHVAKSDVYRCPAGERAIHRFTTVEHVFGTLKHWMGPAHFLTRTPGRVSTEMSIQVLAYNLKRVMNILGVAGTMKAMTMIRS